MAVTSKDRSVLMYNLAMGIALVGLLVATVVMGLLRLADSLAPQIGDIISFGNGRKLSTTVQQKIVVTRVGGASGADCVLEPRVLRSFGGSIIIEAYRLQPRRVYWVHWKGFRTSAGAADCGPVADLMLSRSEVVELMSAASGSVVTSPNALHDLLSSAAATSLN
jgi:hypothetical protein